MTPILLVPGLVVLASSSPTLVARSFDVPAQPLAGALLQIARQGKVNILASERLTRGKTAPAIRAVVTPVKAVELALAKSDLTWRVAEDGTVVILRREKIAKRPPPVRALAPPPVERTVAPAPPAPAVEDIVVQAQRRPEMAQAIPLAITAFGREALSLAGIGKAIDLQQVEPSLVMSAQSGVIIPFLRGVGNPASSTAGNESSVPVYIDEVYFSRLYPAYLTLDHVDRVEVLKGPQGTLFGRNSTGGLIQIFTRDPRPAPEMEVEAGLGNYRTASVKAYLAGPIADGLSANLSISARDQGSGWGTNRTTGGEAYSTDFVVVRSKLLWDIVEGTRLRLSAFHVRENSSTGTVQGGGVDGLPRGLPPDFTERFAQPRGFYDVATDFPTRRRHRGWGGTLKLEQALPFGEFSSLSFYRRSKDPWTSEGDHTPFPWLQYTLPVLDSQVTQELQLKSRPDSRVRWIVGAYYMRAKARIDHTAITGEAVSRQGFLSYNLAARQSIASKAVYGQATVPFGAGRTRLTAGLRYTDDRVHGSGEQFAILRGTGERRRLGDRIDDTAQFGKATFRFAIDRDLGEGAMAFASYSRGFKSGTYNLIPMELPVLDPEQVDAIELGLKATLLDGRMQANLSAFRNAISDPQVQVVKTVADVATNRFVNAGRSRSRGVEFAGVLQIGRRLTGRLSGQYLDSRFVSFRDAPFNTPLFAPPFGVVTAAGDASGNATPLSPKWKVNLGLTYSFVAARSEVIVDGNLAHRSRFKWEPDNRITEPALTLVNASVTIGPAHGSGWSLRLWSNNITNRKYFSNVLTQSGPTGFMSSPAEPRTFGAAIRYKL